MAEFRPVNPTSGNSSPNYRVKIKFDNKDVVSSCVNLPTDDGYVQMEKCYPRHTPDTSNLYEEPINLPPKISASCPTSLEEHDYENVPSSLKKPSKGGKHSRRDSVTARKATFSIKTGFDTCSARPGRMALSCDQDYLFLTDTGNKFIKKFDRNGELECIVLDYNDINDAEPSTITSLTNGNILVGYWNANGLLREINPNNKGIYHDISTPATELPFTAQTSKGDLIVSDYKTSSLYLCKSSGRPMCKFGTTGPKIKDPISIHIDKRDWIYVSLLGKAVHVYDDQLDFQFAYEGGAGFTPYGMTTDEDTNLLIADRDNHRIHLVSEDGKFIKYILASNDGIKKPRDIVCTNDNQLFVACADSNIRVYDYYRCEIR